MNTDETPQNTPKALDIEDSSTKYQWAHGDRVFYKVAIRFICYFTVIFNLLLGVEGVRKMHPPRNIANNGTYKNKQLRKEQQIGIS